MNCVAVPSFTLKSAQQRTTSMFRTISVTAAMFLCYRPTPTTTHLRSQSRRHLKSFIASRRSYCALSGDSPTQHLGDWPLIMDLSMIFVMLLHGPAVSATPPCTISIHHSATLITYGVSLLSYDHPSFHMALDSLVRSIICILISVDHLLITGAKSLVNEHERLPLDHRYLRCAERHDLPGDDECSLVICMTARMSSLLVEAKRISIDTSFKRVRGWQEFEIEGWDNSHQRCKDVPAMFRLFSSYSSHSSNGVSPCIYNVTIC